MNKVAEASAIGKAKQMAPRTTKSMVRLGFATREDYSESTSASMIPSTLRFM
jgi:hypothetical protein